MEIIGTLIIYVLYALNVAIFGRVIMSWVAPNPRNPLSMLIIQITEPILGPIRQGISKIAPKLGMLDLSPMVALALINLVILPNVKGMVFG